MKTAVFADFSLAHVVRAIAYAKERAFGDVHFFCHCKYQRFVPNEFIFHNIYTIPALPAWGIPFTKEIISHYVRDDIEVLNELQPDLIITDVRHSLMISKDLLGFEVTALTNQYWNINGNTHGYDKYLKQWIKPFNEVREMLKLDPIEGDLRHLIHHADKVVYIDHEKLIDDVPIAENVTRMSLLNSLVDEQLPCWWNDLPEAVCYVCMGTTGMACLTPMIIQALQMIGLTPIVSTVEQIKLDYKYSADYLPGNAACKRSILIICNGGHSSFDALDANIPIIGITDNLDQKACMRRIVELGLGMEIPMADCSISTIINAINTLSNKDGSQHKQT